MTHLEGMEIYVIPGRDFSGRPILGYKGFFHRIINQAGKDVGASDGKAIPQDDVALIEITQHHNKEEIGKLKRIEFEKIKVIRDDEENL